MTTTALHHKKICVIDNATPQVYTQEDATAKENSLSHAPLRRPHLKNGISRTCEAMPSWRGADMNHRQKLNIDGTEQWFNFNSTQQLVNIVAEIVKAQNNAKPVIFKAYAESWFVTYKEPQLDKNTAEGFRSKLRKHIYPFIGDKLIDDIRAADVQAVVSSCTSASSAKWAKSIVNMVLDAAIADELYTHPNPAKDKRIVMPTERAVRKGLDRQDLRIVMDFIPKLPREHARLLVLMLMTGCRRGEALGARWEDIDWTNKTIHLQRVVRFRHNRPEVSEKMKTRSANRTVSLWDEFIPYLGTPKPEGFIIEVEGQPLSERQYINRWQAIQKLLSEAGLEERFTAHQLRHTYATIAANSGKVPPKVLQGMLGHANFQTTMNIYAGLDAEKMRESSLHLSEEFSKVTT